MKLKYITLLSFILFVGGFVAMAFLGPVTTPDSSALLNSSLGQQTLNTQQIPNIENLPKVSLDLTEIAKHSTRADCYLIVKGSVYDVTNFIDKHPGGAKKITERCGQEATAIFSTIHSNFAWNLLKDYYLGAVGESVGVGQKVQNSTIPASASVLSDAKGGNDSKNDTNEAEDEYEYEDEHEYEDD